MSETVGELLGRCLRARGVRRVFGRALPGLARIPVDDAELARLLADADGRLGSGPGAALLAGGVLRLSSRPGAEGEPIVLSEPERLPGIVASWSIADVHTAAEYLLDVDLDAPAPTGAEPLDLDVTGEYYSLSPSLAEVCMIVLAGPGVVRSGHVDDLRVFAEQSGLGVLNTWGAKGVFRWDSPHHLGTGGLQARDAELAGLDDADIVIAVGVDPDETPPGAWSGGQVLDVEPWQLPALALQWPEPTATPERPPLYTELAAALQPLYRSDVLPLTPARAAADLAESRPAGGLVVADPGPAGLWVARAFPTTEAGSVIVPATVAPGFAAAAAWLAGLDGRPAVGVTTAPLDDATAVVLDLARTRGGTLVLEEWGEVGESRGAGLGDAASHGNRLATALRSGGVQHLATPVDFSATRTLVEVAGPVVAWGSPPD